MTNEQTVFVVDDDEAALESVAALVKSMKVNAETFRSAEEFLDRYDGARGCLVTDVRMGGMNGLELQERLKAADICLPVIMITAYGQVPLAVNAMKNGALMFLEKSCSEHELWDAIAKALSTERSNWNSVAERRSVESRLGLLSQDERNVLDALLEGTPNKVIAVRLGIALRTVEKRRAAVMNKMAVDSLAELVRLLTRNVPVGERV